MGPALGSAGRQALKPTGSPASGVPATLARLDEPRFPSSLAPPALGPGDVAGLPGNPRPVRDRHLPAGLLGHRRIAGRHAGADAADAVGLPVRLCADEPV